MRRGGASQLDGFEMLRRVTGVRAKFQRNERGVQRYYRHGRVLSKYSIFTPAWVRGIGRTEASGPNETKGSSLSHLNQNDFGRLTDANTPFP